jgi:fatty acid desaturase
MILGAIETCQYLFSRNRKKLSRQLTINEIGFYVVAIGLCFVNLKAAMVILIIPFLFARLVMMMGNWTQHSFVDPREPDNELASTLICMNTPYNQKCWNDGYHAIHHIRPGAHYTEHPVIFKNMVNEMASNRTFIFEKIHYLHIFIFLITKRYDRLADHLVNINGDTFRDRNDAITLMKARTRKFPKSKMHSGNMAQAMPATA